VVTVLRTLYSEFGYRPPHGSASLPEHERGTGAASGTRTEDLLFTNWNGPYAVA
jgi:hypothetical protein